MRRRALVAIFRPYPTSIHKASHRRGKVQGAMLVLSKGKDHSWDDPPLFCASPGKARQGKASSQGIASHSLMQGIKARGGGTPRVLTGKMYVREKGPCALPLCHTKTHKHLPRNALRKAMLASLCI